MHSWKCKAKSFNFDFIFDREKVDEFREKTEYYFILTRLNEQ